MNDTGQIILMCGLPGSGKSTWLKRTTDVIPQKAVVLCPDEFRFALTGKWFYRPAESAVWSAVKTAARVLAGFQSETIVIDATCLTVGSRADWIGMARDIKVPINCVFFDVSLKICKERNQARERSVPENIMDGQAKALVPPTKEEGFGWVITNDKYT